MNDQINLKVDVLSDDAEHQVIGLLLNDPTFARNVLISALPHELNNIKLAYLLKLFYEAFATNRRKKTPSQKDIIFLIENQHKFDLPRQKDYTQLLLNCISMADGLDPDLLYGKMQEVARNKNKMKKTYDMALMFDQQHNPLLERSGPEFDQKLAEAAQAVLDSTKPMRDGAPSPEETLALLQKQSAAWEQAVQRRVPLIDKEVNSQFMLTPGITLIGGQTKSGKSTILANLVPAILEHSPTKKVLIITCEDNLDMVLSRIACVMHEVPLKTYRESKKDMKADQLKAVEDTKIELCNRIVVVSEGTTQTETVQSVLEEAKNEDYAAVMLDYYQVVNTSRYSRNLGYVEILKNLGLWLKEYSQNLIFPLIVFAQLKGNDENAEVPFAYKVQMDSHIANHAHVSLQINKHESPDSPHGPYTEVTCELSRHGDKLGSIAKFKFVGGKLKFFRENTTLASHLQTAPPPSQAELTKQADALIAANKPQPTNG